MLDACDHANRFKSKMPLSKERTQELYNKHHEKFLTPLGKTVKLKFNKNKGRAAVCFFNPLEISISEYYLESDVVTETDVNDTILHEMAHAIAGHEAMHGPKWKRVAKRLGCSAERCTNAFLASKHYKYSLKCGKGCIVRRHRLKRGKIYVCKSHKLIMKSKSK